MASALAIPSAWNTPPQIASQVIHHQSARCHLLCEPFLLGFLSTVLRHTLGITYQIYLFVILTPLGPQLHRSRGVCLFIAHNRAHSRCSRKFVNERMDSAEVYRTPCLASPLNKAVKRMHSPLQGEAPGYDGHILRESHGQQHFGAEEPRVPDLHPLLQACEGRRRRGQLMWVMLGVAVSLGGRMWAWQRRDRG